MSESLPMLGNVPLGPHSSKAWGVSHLLFNGVVVSTPPFVCDQVSTSLKHYCPLSLCPMRLVKIDYLRTGQTLAR